MKILKYVLSLFGLITIGLLSNCKDCPPSEQIGEVFLQDSSLMFHPYQGDETLTFVNSEGDKKVFMSNRSENSDHTTNINVEEICNPGGFSERSLVYYSSEGHRRFFEASALDYFFYDISTIAMLGEEFYSRDTILYDHFNLGGVVSGNGISYINIVTSHRGSFDRLDTMLNDYDNNFEFVEDTVLFERNFKNVYYRNDSENTFFFSAGIGVVAINDGDELWVIEN